MGFQGQSGRWLCVAHILEEQKQIMFYSILDVLVPEDKIYKVAEYVSRANFGLYIGNFRIGLGRRGSPGSRRPSTWTASKDLVTPSLVQQLAYTNVTTVDRYLPGLVSVIFSESTPEEAIAMAEEENPAAAKRLSLIGKEIRCQMTAGGHSFLCKRSVNNLIKT